MNKNIIKKSGPHTRKTKYRHSISRKIFLAADSLLLFFLAAAVIIPVIKIFGTSLCTYPAALWGTGFFKDVSARVYKALLELSGCRYAILTSVITTFAVTVIGLYVSSTCAYITARRNIPGAKFLTWMIVLTVVFDAGIIPKFMVMKELGLLDSLWAVILPLSVNVFNIMLLREYFRGLPESLYEAAELDGCSPLKTYFSILLPMMKAPLAAVGLFFSSAAWNEYIGYWLYIDDMRKYNMQLYLKWTLFERMYFWEERAAYPRAYQAAMIILILLPTLLMMPLFMKFCVPAVEDLVIKE